MLKFTLLILICLATEAFIGPRLSLCGEDFGITGNLGSGSFGNVYKAIDTNSGEIVALKVIDTKDGDELPYVLLEIRAMERVKGQKHSVQLFCSQIGMDYSYLVMEFCNGGDLESRMRQISQAEGLKLWNDMAIGLSEMHATGVIHRDLKPANVFVHDGRLKIGDFGVAIAAEDATEGVDPSGTLSYLAPEIIQFKPFDASSDLWSAGVLFYEVFNKKHPYRSFGGRKAQTVPELLKKMRAFILFKKTILKRMDSPVGTILYELLHRKPSSRKILYSEE